MNEGRRKQLNWNELYQQNGRALTLYARQWTGSMADAEDAVQNAFVRVFKAEKPDPDKLLTYLYQATRWAALDHIRSHSRRKSREEFAHVAMDTRSWFESSLESDERERQIQEALKSLPEEQREVLVMKIWGGLTFKRIAEIIGASPNTTASRYRYALEALRSNLNPEMLHEQC